MIVKLIKRLLGQTHKKEKEPATEKKLSACEADFIDYDGMGNQGRFPKKRK